MDSSGCFGKHSVEKALSVTQLGSLSLSRRSTQADQPAFCPEALGLLVQAMFTYPCCSLAFASTQAFWIGFVCTAVVPNTAMNPDFNIALNYLLSPSKNCSGLQEKFSNSVDPTIFLALKLKYWVAPSIIKFLFS